MMTPSRWQPHWFSLHTSSPASFWPVRMERAAHLNRTGHLNYAVVNGPIFPLLVAWQPTAIVLTQLLCHQSVDEALDDWQDRYPNQQWSANSDLPFAVEALLTGNEVGETIPLAMDGTAFQQAVWKTLLQVPSGQVISYAGLAAASGFPRGGRAVGSAMAANPIPVLVPCHRVIRSDGQPGNYGSGTDIKVHMLQWEATHCCDT